MIIVYLLGVSRLVPLAPPKFNGIGWSKNMRLKGKGMNLKIGEIKLKESSVKVIFRKFKNWRFRTEYMLSKLIAIFPEEATDKNIDHCSSYMHIGQHGVCSISHVMNLTVPAKPKEYRFLKEELEGKGYNLEVRLRISRKMNDLRCKRAANC